MHISYPTDYIIIAFVFVFSVAGVLYVRKSIHDLSFQAAIKEATLSLLVGVLFVLVSSITNSLIDNQWNYNYVVSFLLLKTVNRDWYSQFPRHICAAGYIFIILAIAIILTTFSKKRNEINQQ